MEKQKPFLNEAPNNFAMEMLSNPDHFSASFLNQNWEASSMDQSDPFESALSSMVSSPNANANAPIAGSGGDTVMIRELIGRLGNICNSEELSPYLNRNNNSTNTSCYSTPLNSPPKLNLSMMDPQIRVGNSLMMNHPQGIAPFPADPAFVERAARYSTFGSGNLARFGLSESELAHRLMPVMDPAKLSRVSSNQSMKVAGAGSPANVQESNGKSSSPPQPDGSSKFSRLSRSSTPENGGDSREESSLSEHRIPGWESSLKIQSNGDANGRKRKSITRGKAKETPSSSPSASDAKVTAENNESGAKRSKSDEANGNEKNGGKVKEEEKQNKDDAKPPEPPKDYIHVRARRGQATDSHSLAERVRREKISERMKFLQDLVPGCNKVTGKAVMLDEIINYVQSLQRQVEFLSMKLATVNPRMDFNMEALLSKEMLQSRGSVPHNLYPMDSSSPAFPYGYHQSQQFLPLQQNGMPSNAESQLSVNPVNALLRRNPNMQMPSVDAFCDGSRQVPTFWEDDLQSVVQMGLGQNQESFHGSLPSAQMKVEL
ncbi:hypothetical protein Tsubulata_039390 [Turnera subulata]|uniref:BHLH domain-containing protein n=1 Tax=Turnera subulata TaxID=218843 RepID=A0A9Q0JIU7_9ROSI|nr:hypothetical protein Tsubulata_039390 [Turnera subulata]